VAREKAERREPEEGTAGGTGRRRASPAEEARREAFRTFLRRRLEEVGVGQREFARIIGREETWTAQLLEGRRNVPGPEELRKASVALKTPLLDLLEMCWGVDRDLLVRDLHADAATLAARSATEVDVSALSETDRRTVMEFVGYLRAKSARDAARGSSGAGA